LGFVGYDRTERRRKTKKIGKYGREEGTWKRQQRGNIKRRKYKKNFKMKNRLEEPYSTDLALWSSKDQHRYISGLLAGSK
jgi:hypothetical protein